MKKRGIGENPPLKKKRASFGFAWVMGRPAGSTRFCRVVASTGLLTNQDRSSHLVDLPGWSRFNNSANFPLK